MWVVSGFPSTGTAGTGEGGLGVSLALVHVLQPAQLLQELGPGVAIVTGGAWPRSQSFL